MGRPLARKGDLFVGVCTPCLLATVTGVLIGDAKKGRGNKRKISLKGGIGVGFCGHTTMIVGGSGTVRMEGRRVARIGTPVACDIRGQIITGSHNIKIGD